MKRGFLRADSDPADELDAIDRSRSDAVSPKVPSNPSAAERSSSSIAIKEEEEEGPATAGPGAGARARGLRCCVAAAAVAGRCRVVAAARDPLPACADAGRECCAPPSDVGTGTEERGCGADSILPCFKVNGFIIIGTMNEVVCGARQFLFFFFFSFPFFSLNIFSFSFSCRC